MLQDLFKCKPAIMRAFQAAKGAHTVIGCDLEYFGVAVGYFASSGGVTVTLFPVCDVVRAEVAEATNT